jgi:transcriptional antiterminator RfaH
MQGVEVLNPRLRFTRATRYGPVWVTESLFPNYLFARFDLMAGLNRIQYAPGVNTVVHFGDRWPTVPDGVIEEIRTRLGPESVHVVPNEFEPGEKAVLCAGAFQGLEVVITQALPGRKRVEVLLDFLGRQTSVIVSPNSLVKQTIRF